MATPEMENMLECRVTQKCFSEVLSVVMAEKALSFGWKVNIFSVAKKFMICDIFVHLCCEASGGAEACSNNFSNIKLSVK